MPLSETPTKTVLARVPYLNCAPFFHGLKSESWDWADVPPRQLGVEAEAGRIAAGPMALADFLRLQDRFERLGPLGIAVRGRVGSVMLFSRKPIRQLEGATIAVTEDSSTSALLLRLILEQRYKLSPKAYQRNSIAETDVVIAPDVIASEAKQSQKDCFVACAPRNDTGKSLTDADALLLIGDEALTFRATNKQYPYETDLAFEWWLWQHLPMVFAVWAVRKDWPADAKQRLSRTIQQQLANNLRQLPVISQERAASMQLPADEIQHYLGQFIYRLSQPEEDAIKQFNTLLHEHHLL